MNIGPILMSPGDKGFQSLLRQGDKNCKNKVIDLSFEKYFD